MLIAAKAVIEKVTSSGVTRLVSARSDDNENGNINQHLKQQSGKYEMLNVVSA